MARGKKTDETAPAKQRKARGAKSEVPVKAKEEGDKAKHGPDAKAAAAEAKLDAKLATAEAKLVQRYANKKFQAGSLLPAGAVPAFGHKRSIIILCEKCGAERRVATSDVFHVKLCETCKKTKKKEDKK